MLYPLFAQVMLPDYADDAATNALSAIWDDLWNRALTGTIYQTLVTVGSTIAVICLLFWLYKFYESVSGRGAPSDWTEIITPLLVIILLSGQGAMLRDVTIGLRGYINQTNETMLASVGEGIRMERALNALADYSTMQSQIGSLRRACDSFTDTEQLQSCFTEQRMRADELLSQARSRDMRPDWLEAIQNSVADNFNEGLGEGLVETASSIVAAPFMLMVEVFMVAMQGAFQYLVEVSMLLTALVGPIALGASLMPVGAKPFYAWITAFFSLGMVKMALNIISGLVATAIESNGPAGSNLVAAIALGFLSPVLAFSLAAGGGMATFNAICAASSSAIKLGTKTATGGFG